MSSNEKLGYLPGIDGLRAISVVSVMIYHLKANYLRGGFVGVDVFFVISGFVVTLSICNRRFTSMGELVAYFYARRMGRIVPALALMLVVSTAIRSQLCRTLG
jgi:peptidoglycan/LPS O-acetylase OafA/YrhL